MTEFVERPEDAEDAEEYEDIFVFPSHTS
jgi:hypothetical protein